MALLDRGTETVLVHPSEDATDPYGTPERRPSSEGVTAAGVFVLAVGGSENAGEGQNARPRYRLVGRALLALENFDAFSAVTWRGRRYDVIGPPVRREYPPRLAHVSALLQER